MTTDHSLTLLEIEARVEKILDNSADYDVQPDTPLWNELEMVLDAILCSGVHREEKPQPPKDATDILRREG